MNISDSGSRTHRSPSYHSGRPSRKRPHFRSLASGSNRLRLRGQPRSPERRAQRGADAVSEWTACRQEATPLSRPRPRPRALPAAQLFLSRCCLRLLSTNFWKAVVRLCGCSAPKIVAAVPTPTASLRILVLAFQPFLSSLDSSHSCFPDTPPTPHHSQKMDAFVFEACALQLRSSFLPLESSFSHRCSHEHTRMQYNSVCWLDGWIDDSGRLHALKLNSLLVSMTSSSWRHTSFSALRTWHCLTHQVYFPGLKACSPHLPGTDLLDSWVDSTRQPQRALRPDLPYYAHTHFISLLSY